MTKGQYYDGIVPATLVESEINQFIAIHDAICEILQELSALLYCPEERESGLAAIREKAAHIVRHASSPSWGEIDEAAD